MFYARNFEDDYDAHCPKCGNFWGSDMGKDPGYLIYVCEECGYGVQTYYDTLVGIISEGDPEKQKEY